MKRWNLLIGFLFALFVLGLFGDASAQLVRPAATPRTAATARPVATVRIPAEGAAGIPSGSDLWLKSDTEVYSDAAGTTAVNADDQRIRAIRDQSTNARLLVESTDTGAGWPKWQTAETVSGEPAIEANDSGNAWLGVTGVTDLLTADVTFTMGFVIKFSSGTGTIFSQDEGGGATDKWILDNGWASGSGVGLHINGSAGSANISSATAASTTAYQVWVVRRKSDNTWVWRRNGTQVASGSSATTFSSPNTGEIKFSEAESVWGDYLLEELVIYDEELSDSDMTMLEDGLNSRCTCY